MIKDKTQPSRHEIQQLKDRWLAAWPGIPKEFYSYLNKKSRPGGTQQNPRTGRT